MKKSFLLLPGADNSAESTLNRLGRLEEKLQELTDRIGRLVMRMQPIDKPFWIPVSPDLGPSIRPPCSGNYLLTLDTGELTIGTYDAKRNEFDFLDWEEIAAWAHLPDKFRGDRK